MTEEIRRAAATIDGAKQVSPLCARVQQRRNRLQRIKRGVVAVVTYVAEDEPPGSQSYLPDVMRLHGSGFLVSSDGWIVTNQHVVRPYADACRRYLSGDVPRPPQLRVALNTAARPQNPWEVDNFVLPVAHSIHSEPYDLALLKVPVPPGLRTALTPLDLATRPCKEGDLVVTCGFPLGWRLQADQLKGSVINASFSRGMVASSVDARGGSSRFALDMMINAGNSGGPICHLDSGLVVGVIEQRAYRPVDALLSDIGVQLQPHVPDRYGVPVGRGRGIHIACLHELLALGRSEQAVPSKDEPFRVFEDFRYASEESSGNRAVEPQHPDE